MSLQEPILRRSDSRASVFSVNSVTSQDVEHINAEYQAKSRTGSKLDFRLNKWFQFIIY